MHSNSRCSTNLAARNEDLHYPRVNVPFDNLKNDQFRQLSLLQPPQIRRENPKLGFQNPRPKMPKFPPKFDIGPLVILGFFLIRSDSACHSGCPLAYGSYLVSPNLNFTYISSLFALKYADFTPYNPSVPNAQFIQAGHRVNVTFPCDCINGDFLGRIFAYVTIKGDTYDLIAKRAYANLTTATWIAGGNSYPPTRVPDGVKINVTVNCSCGNPAVSMEYGLFETYPLTEGESLASVAGGFGLSGKEELLQLYNPGVNFSAGSGIVFVPVKGELFGFLNFRK